MEEIIFTQRVRYPAMDPAVLRDKVCTTGQSWTEQEMESQM
jgi:hypothetical protein